MDQQGGQLPTDPEETSSSTGEQASEPKSREYWLSRTADERIAEIERLRQAKYPGYDPAMSKVPLVMRVLKLGQEDDE